MFDGEDLIGVLADRHQPDVKMPTLRAGIFLFYAETEVGQSATDQLEITSAPAGA
jgi:hypothetical protein